MIKPQPLSIVAAWLLAIAVHGRNAPAPAGAPGKAYTITGAVKRPGVYPLTAPTTVFDAINSAGGFQDNFSDRQDIVIIRGDRRLHFNYRTFVRGQNRDTNENLRIDAGDVVQVKSTPPGPTPQRAPN